MMMKKILIRRTRWMLGFATLVALCFVPADAADAPAYRWKTVKDSLSLMAGDQVVYTCQFAAENGYPYIHPVSMPGGPVLTAMAPKDHPWHRGLWFSWKFYLSDTTDLPYFGPALLFDEPMTLKAGESFAVKYRILVHPGPGDKTVLEKEYQEFAK